MATISSGSNTSISTSGTTNVLEKVSTPVVPIEAVRTVSLKDSDRAAECLIQAFAKDEIARYFIDTDDMAKYDEEIKWKLHCDILRYITAAHCLDGLVTAVGDKEDEFGAVALWLPPHTSIDSFYTLFRSGLWRLYYKLSAEGRHRYFTEFMPLLHDTKHDTLGQHEDASYYLVYLGSKPSARGKGYARVLIEHGIQLADAQTRMTYLESSAHSNIEYYKKFGFIEKCDIVLNRGIKPLYLHIMVRYPANAAAPKDEARTGDKTIVMSKGALATAQNMMEVKMRNSMAK